MICTWFYLPSSAARVNEYIDGSVDPCENFFDYACGNWIKKHPIPEDRSSIDTFGVLRDEVEVILKGKWSKVNFLLMWQICSST